MRLFSFESIFIDAGFFIMYENYYDKMYRNGIHRDETDYIPINTYECKSCGKKWKSTSAGYCPECCSTEIYMIEEVKSVKPV